LEEVAMQDLSDQPHAILAYLNNCEAIITYDEHFKDIAHLIPVHTPEEFLKEQGVQVAK